MLSYMLITNNLLCSIAVFIFFICPFLLWFLLTSMTSFHFLFISLVFTFIVCTFIYLTCCVAVIYLPCRQWLMFCSHLLQCNSCWLTWKLSQWFESKNSVLIMCPLMDCSQHLIIHVTGFYYVMFQEIWLGIFPFKQSRWQLCSKMTLKKEGKFNCHAGKWREQQRNVPKFLRHIQCHWLVFVVFSLPLPL